MLPYSEFRYEVIRQLDVVFFSRGRGRGHAYPDSVIAEELFRLIPTKLTFVSYGTGAEALTSMGYEVIDLGLPENNPIFETIIRSIHVLADRMPSIVVSHEEFGSLIAAKVLSLPSLFLTSWFADPTNLMMDTLNYADEILFMEDRGIFTEPPYLKDKITYVGPLVRPLQYSRFDRARARLELGIADDTFIITCLPGASHERDNPVINLVVGAYNCVPVSKKQLFWIGSDATYVQQQCLGRSDVLIEEFREPIEQIMVASDIVVTKGTRNTLRELNALGVPSISLSSGSNWVDDILASRLTTNLPLITGDIGEEALAELMMLNRAKENANVDNRSNNSVAPPGRDIAERIAARGMRHIEALENKR